MRHSRVSDRGFTLVELMVVVLIIGILVSIAVPVFLSASAKAQSKACQANQRMISGAVEMIASMNGRGGSTAGELKSGGSGWYAELVPTWMRSNPACPLNQTAYLMDAAGAIMGDQNAVVGFKTDHRAP